MSLLKHILSPFVEFKNEKKEASAKETKAEKPVKEPAYAPAEKASNTGGAPAYSYRPSGADASSVPAQYQKYFDDLIEEANAKNPLFAGTDFKEFMDSKVDVEAIPDEAVRYRTAFNVLKRTGLTKEKLLTTGQAYLNLIDRDLQGFENAYAQQYKNEVEGRERLLQQKRTELQALTEKITALNAEIKNLSEEISQNKDRLGQNRDLFRQAGEQKKKELLSELEKIEHYFSG